MLGGISDWGDEVGVDNEGCEVAERSCASSLSDKPAGIVTGITRSGEDDDGPSTGLVPLAFEEYVPVING